MAKKKKQPKLKVKVWSKIGETKGALGTVKIWERIK